MFDTLPVSVGLKRSRDGPHQTHVVPSHWFRPFLLTNIRFSLSTNKNAKKSSGTPTWPHQILAPGPLPADVTWRYFFGRATDTCMDGQHTGACIYTLYMCMCMYIYIYLDSTCIYLQIHIHSLYPTVWPFELVRERKNVRAQMDHPDQAPALSPTQRTPQCGHTVWGKRNRSDSFGEVP